MTDNPPATLEEDLAIALDDFHAGDATEKQTITEILNILHKHRWVKDFSQPNDFMIRVVEPCIWYGTPDNVWRLDINGGVGVLSDRDRVLALALTKLVTDREQT